MMTMAIAPTYHVHSLRRDDSDDGAAFEAGNPEIQDIRAEIGKLSECSKGIIILAR
jgi:hypothetical protein